MIDRTIKIGPQWPQYADAKESKLNNDRQSEKDAGDILAAAAETFKARKAVYKDNFIRLGKSLAQLFPEGVMLKTPEDFIRFHLLVLQQTKISRYVTNWPASHQDSIHDAIVYAALLEAFDEGNASTIR